MATWLTRGGGSWLVGWLVGWLYLFGSVLKTTFEFIFNGVMLRIFMIWSYFMLVLELRRWESRAELLKNVRNYQCNNLTLFRTSLVWTSFIQFTALMLSCFHHAKPSVQMTVLWLARCLLGSFQLTSGRPLIVVLSLVVVALLCL